MARRGVRNYAAEYARRVQRAADRGLSRSQARGHPARGELGIRTMERIVRRPERYTDDIARHWRELRVFVRTDRGARLVDEQVQQRQDDIISDETTSRELRPSDLPIEFVQPIGTGHRSLRGNDLDSLADKLNDAIMALEAGAATVIMGEDGEWYVWFLDRSP